MAFAYTAVYVSYETLQWLTTFNKCASKDYGQYILTEISAYIFWYLGHWYEQSKWFFEEKKSKNSFWLVSPITRIRASLIFVSNKCNRCNRQLNELRKDFLWNIFIFSIYSFHKNKCNWDSRLAQLLHCFFAFISFASRHYMKQPRRFSFVILTNLVTS